MLESEIAIISNEEDSWAGRNNFGFIEKSLNELKDCENGKSLSKQIVPLMPKTNKE